jgi:hypothetical protein
MSHLKPEPSPFASAYQNEIAHQGDLQEDESIDAFAPEANRLKQA